MTISGRWAGSAGAYETFSGSANWANLAFGDDEQMQLLASRAAVLRHNAAFYKTWRQQSSSAPSYGRVAAFGRAAALPPTGPDIPARAPAFGKGVFRYMDKD